MTVSTDTLTGRARALTLWAGRLIAAVATLHLVYFLTRSLEFVPDWAGGGLWTPVQDGEPMPRSQAYFWQWAGSFAVPTLLLGLLFAWSAREGRALPGWVTWGFAGWSLLCALILLPSGFPLLVVASALLIAARRR